MMPPLNLSVSKVNLITYVHYNYETLGNLHQYVHMIVISEIIICYLKTCKSSLNFSVSILIYSQIGII